MKYRGLRGRGLELAAQVDDVVVIGFASLFTFQLHCFRTWH
jgi:hypothetical protein